jgi:tetratricopeptide (TPR) repeat protein
MTQPLLVCLSPAEVRQIDQTCDRFEEAWKARQRPDLQEYLGAAVGPVRSALLRQLLLLDWDYRRRAGDEPDADDYHRRFPGDRAVVEEVRRESSESPNETQELLDKGGERHTPGPGETALDLAGEFVAPTEAGSDRYELLQEIGHGGIGVVFRGRDRHLGRELAVKVLREAYRDRADARHRFIEEARVGSQLQHPAIVPVYEQGWYVDRRPFLTMKLVEGHTLAALLNERADPSEDLPRMLGIFEQVCQAMAYAHARGVVHRDLKPANIMVGAFGEVQVMDWGFAKVLAGEGTSPASAAPKDCAAGPVWMQQVQGQKRISQSGMVMGTPAYMPPEQARGEAALIDPRADVFALGGILCEILTGWPPYLGSTAEEVYGKAATGNLADAHLRLQSCGADEALKQLARRSLANERTDRPTDAGVVARDFTAYLASAQQRHRQAQLDRAAAEARAQESAAKLKAERRAGRLTMGLAAALLAGTAVASWQAVVAYRAEQTALSATTAETQAKEAAQKKEAEVRTVLAFVQNKIFAAARPKGKAGGLGSEVTLRRAIEAALPVVESSFADQPLVEARLRMVLGESFVYLGEAQTAAKQFQRAQALYTEHLGPNHADTLQSMNNLANCYAALGRPDLALALRKEVLELRTEHLGPDHSDTLYSLNNLANSYDFQGEHKKALELRLEVVARRKALLGPDHEDTLWALFNLAGTYSKLGRLEDALKLWVECAAKRTATLGRDHLDTIDCLSNVGLIYAAMGRYDKALPLLEETLKLRRSKLDRDHPYTLDSMTNLANVYHAVGQYREAIALHEEALALRKAKFGLGPISEQAVVGMSVWARIGQAQCRQSIAPGPFPFVLAVAESVITPPVAHHPETLRSMHYLASSYAVVGRHAEALELHDAALKGHQLKFGAKHPATIASFFSVASCRMTIFAKAKDVAGCRATVDMCEKLAPTDPDGLYSLACYRAITAAVLRGRDKSPENAKQANVEADRAMSWLKRAVAAGFKNVAHMQKDKDLDALRDRADFWKLLAELTPEG